jgi:Phage replication protein CRI
MIDWFTGYVGYDASRMAIGRFWEVDRHGEVVRERPRWETAKGSFESGVQVTKFMPTDGMRQSAAQFGFLCADEVLKISGNPAKYLQSHNVTGPSVALLGPVLQGVVRAFPDELRPHDADSLILPAVHRSRVDVNTLVDMGSHQAVHDWLMLAETKTKSKHGRASSSQGTVYWGKHSTRWAMKAYCKHCELKKHPPADLDLLPDLLEWTETFLRIELVLRRPELVNRGPLDESLIWEYFAKLEINTMRVNTYSEAKGVLPTGMKLALGTWYAGTDLKCFLPERTFYRYRKEILGVTGIDIALPYVNQGAEAVPVLLGMDELFKREVKNVPERIQRSLFGAGV